MNRTLYRAFSVFTWVVVVFTFVPQSLYVEPTIGASEQKGVQNLSYSLSEFSKSSSLLPQISSPSRMVTGTIPTSFTKLSSNVQVTRELQSLDMPTSLPKGSHYSGAFDKLNVLYLPLILRVGVSHNFIPSAPTDSIAWIENVWVNSSNQMWVRINTIHPERYYRLYVRKHGETFGDPPHYQYYQIYPGTFPKDLYIIANLEPNTVYCVEIRSNDNSTRHDITSYKTGGSGPPYYGGVCREAYCPADYTTNIRLTGDLVISPSTPIEGQSVTASFPRICNDGWNNVTLNQVYVMANTGENWPGMGNQGTIATCSCKTLNYNEVRTFSPGSKTATAGYIFSGNWYDFGRRGSVVNQQIFTVLADADVRLEDGTSLELSPQNIKSGQTVTAVFTVHNYGDVESAEHFRAAVYDETGATYVTSFTVSLTQTLAGGSDYVYTNSHIFDTTGIYWIKAQHQITDTWMDLAGNSRVPLRVEATPPADDPKVKGYAPPCPHAGEPVNTATGNFTSMHTDWTRPGPGMDFTFERFYNAIDANTFSGPLGHGWSHSYQYDLDWRADDTVVITMTDGHIAYFVGTLGAWPDIDPGTYLADDGVLDKLTRDTRGTPGQWDDDVFVLNKPEQMQYHFDTAQRLVRIEDLSGNIQYFGYDLDDRLVQITDTAGITYTLVYSGELITEIASSNGEQIAYDYDVDGNLIAFTNTAGETMTYTYDDQHRLLTGTDPSGRLFVENLYDAQGRVIEQRDAEGYVSYFNYDTLTQTSIYTDAMGNPLIQVYDDQYRMVQEIDALGHAITQTFDADDNVIARRDKNGNLIRFTFDDSGNMLSKTDALGYVWTYTYDDQNNLLTETDPLSATTTYQYDAEGRLILKTDPVGGVTEYAYDAQGQVIWMREPSGAETTYIYNVLGQPITVTNGLSQTTVLDYNAVGRKTRHQDAVGNVAGFDYDAMGRTTVITAPDGGVTRFAYDAMGNLITETNALGYTRIYTYNAYNRLVAESDWDGNVSHHEYDLLGRRIRDVDPLGYTTVYTYDAVGNLVAQQDKNSYVTTYTYDPNGNRLTETDALGHTTTYVYDALDRVVEVINPASCCATSHRYTVYDAAGRVITETDAMGNTTVSQYDLAGRLTARTNPLGETTVYTYDLAGQLLVETDPLGQQTRYAYDVLGQLITTTNRLGDTTVQHYDAVGHVIASVDERGHMTHYLYDSADRLIQKTDPLGQVTAYTYDLLGNQLTATDANGYTQTFTYDPNGNLLTETDANGHTTHYRYDARGQLIEKQDALGGVTRYTYDPNGNLLTEIDPLSRTTQYEYDALGRQVREIDALGNVTRYVYDEAGHFAERIDAEGNAWSYTYDANGNMIAETDPLGRVTHYTYDALNRQVRVTDALGDVFVTRYDALGRVAETVNAGGQRTGYTYDAEGHVIAMSDALGFYQTYTYDPAGNQVQVVNRLGYTTTHAYNALNRRFVMTDALGSTTSWGYDAVGRVLTTTDPLGHASFLAYDAVGNVLTETNALSGTTSYRYDALNRRIAATDANGHTTHLAYDAAGQLVSTTLPGGGTLTYTYDDAGHRVSEIDPAGRAMTWEYDSLGRAIREIDPLGHATEYAFDGVGNLIQERDALGRATHFAYDALNRLARVTDAAGHVTRYVYDPVGNLIVQQDANGHLTRFEYDMRNRRIRETDPLGREWRYQYDAGEQQKALRKPDGTVIYYQYDALGRLVLTDYTDGTSDVAFTYDAAGNRRSMTDGTGVTTYTYDALSRLTDIAYPGGRHVSYTYDGVGNRVGVSYPTGADVTYSYDANDLLASVTTDDGTIAYTRDPAGLPLRIEYPNGAYVENIFDGAGQVIETLNGNTEGIFAACHFELNAVGNKTQKMETLIDGDDTIIVTTTYTYNARDQLVRSVASDGTETSYTFDGAGNRTWMVGKRWREGILELYSIAYAYNAANQLLSANDTAQGRTTYTYDVNGNRVAQASADREVSYRYDAEDRLIQAEAWVRQGDAWVYQDGRFETYAYDGQSRRVEKVALAVGTHDVLSYQSYVYGSDWNVLQETGPSAAVRRYVYDDAMQKLHVLVDATPGYLHYDDLGSVVGYTLDDGAVRAEDGVRRYGDYGAVMQGSAGGWTDTGYTGHEWDTYTGLYYARHRYYDPAVGGWLTLDSYRGEQNDPLSQHRYAYVIGDPINNTDSLGLWIDVIIDIVEEFIEDIQELIEEIKDSIEDDKWTPPDCGEEQPPYPPVPPPSPDNFATMSQVAREADRQWGADKSHFPVVNDVTINSGCGDCFRFVGSVYKALGNQVNPNAFGDYLDNISNSDPRVIWATDRDTTPITWAQLRGGDIHYWLNESTNRGHAMILLDNRTQIAHTNCGAGGLVIQPSSWYDPDYYLPGKPRVRIVRLTDK